jgi:hypothetical protein
MDDLLGLLPDSKAMWVLILAGVTTLAFALSAFACDRLGHKNPWPVSRCRRMVVWCLRRSSVVLAVSLTGRGWRKPNPKPKKCVIVVESSLLIAARGRFETVSNIVADSADRCKHALPGLQRQFIDHAALARNVVTICLPLIMPNSVRRRAQKFEGAFSVSTLVFLFVLWCVLPGGSSVRSA